MPVWLLADACFIIKPKPEPEPPVVVIPNDTPDVVIIDTIRPPIDTIVPPQIVHKDLYQVAVLLPFNIDANFIADFDYRDRTTPYRSMMALELYQGMKLAVNELQRKGVNVKIHVFDTRNSVAEVKRILGRPIMKEVDVIVGPLFDRSTQEVAEYALEHKKYVITPFAKPTVREDNPYLICASASIETHLDAIANMLDAQYADRKLLILRRDHDREEHISAVLSKRLKALNSPIRPQEITAEGWDWIPPGVFGTDTTIIFCPSEDEAFVNEVLRQLSTHVDDSPMILIGMPNWLSEFETVRYDYMAALNMHVTSNLWIDTKAEQVEVLNELYQDSYGIRASEVVFRGYDLITWCATLMKAFGISFANHFNEVDQSALFSRFNILPANHLVRSTQNVPINYYENQYVQILRYKEYELVKVN